MKLRSLFFLLIISYFTTGIGLNANAQNIPQGINYQAIARDNTGKPLANKAIDVQIGIIIGTISDAIIWKEVHALTTNQFGLFTLIIGQGANASLDTSITFSTLNWGASNHFLNVQVDAGSGFEDMGTTQLMSVPYALYAKESGNGPQGLPGVGGISCWDLNGNGIGDIPLEDKNNDGVVDAKDCRGNLGNLQGLGILGQTIYNNGTVWDTSSTLFNNGNRIGIGTTNPTAKLSVLSSDSIVMQLTGSNSNAAILKITATNPNTTVGTLLLSGSDSGIVVLDPIKKMLIISNSTPQGNLIINADSTIFSTANTIASFANNRIFNSADSIYNFSSNNIPVVNINSGTFFTDSLYVLGNGMLQSNWVLTNNGTGKAIWTNPSNINGTGLWQSQAPDIFFNTGKVGIGTNIIPYNLSVFSTDPNIAGFASSHSSGAFVGIESLVAGAAAGNVYINGTDTAFVGLFPTGSSPATQLAVSNPTPNGTVSIFSDSIVSVTAKEIGIAATKGVIIVTDTLFTTTGSITNPVVNVNLGEFFTDSLIVIDLDPTKANWILANKGFGRAIWTDPSTLLSGGTGAFSTTANITSNAPGNFTNDSFVFGAPTLEDDANPNHANKLFFDKTNGSFRVGIGSTNWDLANRGQGSFASGQGTTASGSFSFAAGTGAQASGDISTAMGAGASALSTGDIALGVSVQASGGNSFVAGLSSSATGAMSIALGNQINSTGANSIGLGLMNSISGISAIALGSNNNASGDYAVAMGQNLKASSFHETVIGFRNTFAITPAASSWVLTDRLFTIGNGFGGDANALVMLKNGNTTLNGKLTLSDGIKPFTFPNTDGTNTQVLTTDGNGTASWKTPTATANTDNQNLLNGIKLGNNQSINIQNGSGISFSVADADSSKTNEIQIITMPSINTINLSNGGGSVTITDNVNDADFDPTNEIELPATATLNDVLTWNGTAWVNQAAAVSTDNQNLLNGGKAGNNQTLNIQNGTGISFSIADADSSKTNEIQIITMPSINTINLSNGGGSVTITDNVNDADFDPVNELQALSIRNDTIFLSNGGFAKLPAATTPVSLWKKTGNNLYPTTLTNKVGIGTTTPSAPFHVSKVDTITALFENISIAVTANITTIKSNAIANGTQTNTAFKGVASGGSTFNRGVYGLASGTVLNSMNYGVRGEANGVINGAGTLNNYGIYGNAVNGTTNYGIYGNAAGGGANWAGYFDNGNVYVKNSMGLGAPIVTAKLDIKADFMNLLRIGNTSSPIPYVLVNSSGFMGLGTATPEATIIHIKKNASTTNSILKMGNSSKPGLEWYFDVDGTSVFTLNNESNGSPTTILTANTNGNVGIGTFPVFSKLDVNGKITMRTGAAVGLIPVSDANGTMTWTSPASITTSTPSPWTQSGTDIYNTTLTNNVGIGVATPGAKLHIGGNVMVDWANTTTPALAVSNRNGASPGYATGRLGDVVIVSSAGTEDKYAIQAIAGGNNGDKYGLYGSASGTGAFNYGIYGEASGAPTNWAGFFGMGNVYIQNKLGIGALTPNFGLQVNDAGNNFGRIQITAGTATGTASSDGLWINVSGSSTSILNRENTPLYFGTNATNKMTILPNGNVGIGTTNPSTVLDVNGKITMRTGAAVGLIPVSDANGTMTWTNPASITTSNPSPWTQSGTDIYNTTLTNNVGIGVATPAFPLHVFTNSNVRGIYSETNSITSTSAKIGITGIVNMGAGTGDNIGGSFGAINSTGGNNYGVQVDATGGVGTNYGIRSWASGAAIANWAGYFGSGLTGDGNVYIQDKLSIGTTSLVHALNIESSDFNLLKLTTTGANSNVNIDINTTGAGAAQFEVAGGTGGYRFLTAASSAVRFIIKDNGNVGIGTTNPSTVLDVNGTITLSSTTAEINSVNTGAANMIPIAYGSISTASVINSGTGNFTVTSNVAGVYSIKITGENYNINNYITMITPTGGSLTLISYKVTDNSVDLIVTFFKSTGTKINHGFHFITYKP